MHTREHMCTETCAALDGLDEKACTRVCKFMSNVLNFPCKFARMAVGKHVRQSNKKCEISQTSWLRNLYIWVSKEASLGVIPPFLMPFSWLGKGGKEIMCIMNLDFDEQPEACEEAFFLYFSGRMISEEVRMHVLSGVHFWNSNCVTKNRTNGMLLHFELISEEFAL